MNCKNDECKVRMIKEGTHAKCPDNSITWLDVYGVSEVADAILMQDVLSSPRKYICF